MTIVDLKEKGNIEIKEIPVKPLHDLKTIKGKFSKITSEEFYKELKKKTITEQCLQMKMIFWMQ